VPGLIFAAKDGLRGMNDKSITQYSHRFGPEAMAPSVDFPAYRCRTFSVATNKCPILPYRGVARTGVCFALEVTLDALARDLGIEPGELRMRSLVRPEQMPFDNIAKRHFDSGDYPQALERAVHAIGRASV